MKTQMADHMNRTAQKTTDASPSDMKMVFEFLKMSSPNGLHGAALEDRLLTSLAIALRERAGAH